MAWGPLSAAGACATTMTSSIRSGCACGCSAMAGPEPAALTSSLLRVRAARASATLRRVMPTSHPAR